MADETFTLQKDQQRGVFTVGVDFPTSLLSHRSLCSLTSRPIVRAPGAPGSFANFNGTGLLTKTFRRVGSNFNIIKNGRFLIVLLSWSLEIQIAMEDGRNILFNPFVGHLRVVVSQDSKLVRSQFTICFCCKINTDFGRPHAYANRCVVVRMPGGLENFVKR